MFTPEEADMAISLTMLPEPAANISEVWMRMAGPMYNRSDRSLGEVP